MTAANGGARTGSRSSKTIGLLPLNSRNPNTLPAGSATISASTVTASAMAQLVTTAEMTPEEGNPISLQARTLYSRGRRAGQYQCRARDVRASDEMGPSDSPRVAMTATALAQWKDSGETLCDASDGLLVKRGLAFRLLQEFALVLCRS